MIARSRSSSRIVRQVCHAEVRLTVRGQSRALLRWLRSQVISLIALVSTAGCVGTLQHSHSAADSTGTILGHLGGEFVHGPPPWYGSVVYLIPVAPSTEEWWVRLARPRYGLVGPENDRTLGFSGRTVCSETGEFTFLRAQPGDYYLYARVAWTQHVVDSTIVTGGAWIGTVTVAARETVRVTLRPPLALFQSSPPVRRFPPRLRPDDPDLPRFGENVYVEELPEAITMIAPEYPPEARRAGVDGTVLVQALVDKDGHVRDTRVVKSIPILDEAAEVAVRRWVFKPALRAHKAVAVWYAVPVRFNLEPS